LRASSCGISAEKCLAESVAGLWKASSELCEFPPSQTARLQVCEMIAGLWAAASLPNFCMISMYCLVSFEGQDRAILRFLAGQ
jgi:hypothetical protein